MNITNELDDLVKSFNLYRFQNELNFYKSQNDSSQKYSSQINLLTSIINNLNNTKEVKDNSKSKIQNMFNEIDQMVYKKEWKKLPNFHKNIKIKEYLLEQYNDIKKDELKYIENMLADAVENKKLNNDEYVNYNQNLSKITNISILKKNAEGKLVLEFPTKKNVKTKKNQKK